MNQVWASVKVEKDIKVYYCLYCADFILCLTVTVVGGSLHQYAGHNLSKYIAVKVSQINETLNDIHEEMDSMQQNVIDLSKTIKMEPVKINEDLSF